MIYKWTYSKHFEDYFDLYQDDINNFPDDKPAVVNVWRNHEEWYYKAGIFKDVISQFRSQFKKEYGPFYFAYFFIEKKDLANLNETKLTKAFEVRERNDKIAYRTDL